MDFHEIMGSDLIIEILANKVVGQIGAGSMM
jgi:hypothetical protein